ncbi:hypothetical protein KR009_006349 [Drosophila setifemur]|nr:hypothetical protein KR009_006349 [Drosophila setifemur]
MPEKLLKITYQGVGVQKKQNAYLRMPIENCYILRNEIKRYLFEDRQLPRTEFRIFWIDSDHDEIEIVNQNDYEIFLEKCEQNMHVQIAPLVPEEVEEPKGSKQKASATDAPVPPVDDLSNFTIHDGVECDGCGLAPMIGFRYKCVQCPNFDLCQKCEAAHKHPEHLMVRMPTNDGPGIVEAYLTGPNPWGRRCGRRSRGHCSFAEAAQAAGATQAGEAPRESRRERRHARRHGGVLSQFVEMMTNLPLNEPSAGTGAGATPQQQAKAAPTPEPKTDTKAQPTTVPKTEPSFTAQKAAQTEAKPTEDKKIETEEPAPTPRSSEPTTPVINLDNLSQIVPPEYMRAGIEILNNFSEMFAKMIDPTESAASGSFAPSMASSAEANKPTEKAPSAADLSANQSAAPSANQSTASSANQSATSSAKQSAAPSLNQSRATSISSSFSEAAIETEPLLAKPAAVSATTSDPEQERRRSDSLGQDWQLIDDNGSPTSSNVASTDALINLDSTGPSAAPLQPVRDFRQLGEVLRQHINEEARVEQATANTQTSQVDTVSTSTSTTSVSTNSVGTSPAAPEEKRGVLVYHKDERINSSIHAMMAMGFSNEGAWLTQLLESVQGNIPAALDIMHVSQNRN